MRFSNPAWLAAGALACALLVLMWRRYDARRHAALAMFVSAHLRQQLTRSVSMARRWVQRGLYLGALALLFVALAGPLLGFRWEQISRRGNEIVFAIDTSRSMLTEDVKPNRLARAKLAVDDFTNQLDNDAVGIVAFAGTAFLVCPITLDYGAFHESLAAVDTNTIPRGGTNISQAIREAQIALGARPGSDKILILITDGEDLEGGALDAARSAAQQDGLKIYTVGVGTATGDLIPLPQTEGGGFVKDDTGAFVRSHLDEAALKAIAAASGALYVPLGAQGEGLETVFKAIFGSVAKHDLAYRQQKIYIERYQWPLCASLGMLLASLLVGTRRRRRAMRPEMDGIAVVSILVLLGLLPIHATHASNAGEGADPAKKPVLEYNTGTSAYRAGQYSQAAQAFQQSISRAPSSDSKRLNDQEDAYYNLGNALYRTGQKTQQTSPQATLQEWKEAVKAYETALQLRADDADSKFNRDFVKRKIDELEQKQNQNQNQNQDQDKGSGNPPNQPPNAPQNGKNNDQPQPPQQRPPQQPPPQQPPPQQPPPQQPPPQQPQPQPPPQQPPPQQPQPQPPPQQSPPQQQPQPPPPAGPGSTSDQAPKGDAPPPTAPPGETRSAGQMSPEEARELLDSVKGDERHALGAPLAARKLGDPPEKPFKNW